MDRAAATEIVRWRYDPPYDVYNMDGHEEDRIVQDLTDPRCAYHALFEHGRNLAAFCCFGLDARVQGGDYKLDALDVGMGVRPDLTGRGQGGRFARAVLDFARHTYAPRTFRVTIAAFNGRAQRVWSKLGLRAVQTFAADHSGRSFVIMIGDVDAGSAASDRA